MIEAMIDIKTIKLIIWDLDDTFWQGILSEGGATPIVEHIQLVRDLTDAGIINSICSKNEPEPTIAHLKELGIWEYFVFTSINWDNKGARMAHMIDSMALRPQNVLFIDDNVHNLQEAKHFLPEIQIAEPDVIPELIAQVAILPKKDTAHKRLKQYKVLEEKAEAAKSYDSNEAFLYSSNIRVEMHTDCESHVERLHDLILRSNQLNFTKKRISEEKLRSLIADIDCKCGYVSVTDNYGDYGIVGFYAIRNGKAEHFVFSCRTMGQMIEQWVYAQLGFPELEVVGEVRTQLNKEDCPGWINQANVSERISESGSERVSGVEKCKKRILVKGPCDLSNSLSYIHASDNIVLEFTYVDDRGMVVDTYNHSVHIRGLHEYSEADNQLILKDCPFIDPAMLHGTFFIGDYDLIFLSSLIESSYVIWRRKGTNVRVVMNHQNNYLESDPDFLSKYESEEYTTPGQYVQFLKDCLEWLPSKTELCIILGATYGNSEDALRHKALNDAVKALATKEPRIKYIDVDEFAKNASDFTDGLNHYQTRVYYEIAQAMIRIAGEVTGEKISGYGKYKAMANALLIKGKRIARKYLKPNTRVYNWLKQKYALLINRY